MTKSLSDILPYNATSKLHFPERYITSNQKDLLKEALEREFPTVRERLYSTWKTKRKWNLGR